MIKHIFEIKRGCDRRPVRPPAKPVEDPTLVLVSYTFTYTRYQVCTKSARIQYIDKDRCLVQKVFGRDTEALRHYTYCGIGTIYSSHILL